MRALIATGTGQITFTEVPEPQPRANEALIAVRAVSVNRGEAMDLAGTEAGTRLGWDFAGVVLQPAAGRGPGRDERVLGLIRGGAWSERVAVPISQLGTLPDAVPFAPAAALPVAGLTARRTLALAGDLTGRSVLVTGATGGVGRYAVQLVHAARAHVIAIAAGPRAEGLHELGAELIIANMRARGEPVDVILESAGGASLTRALELVAPGGVVVSYGTSSEQASSIPPFWFGRHFGAHLQGFVIWRDLERAGASRELTELATLVSERQLHVPIGMEVSWQDAQSAVQAVLSRRVAGKAVLWLT